jgi:hypothetical protein
MKTHAAAVATSLRNMKIITLLLLCLYVTHSYGFVSPHLQSQQAHCVTVTIENRSSVVQERKSSMVVDTTALFQSYKNQQHNDRSSNRILSSTTQLYSADITGIPDLNVIGLVTGQENYGLAIVCVGEAIWSFTNAPSLDHSKVLVPAGLAALVLVLVSGPMLTSGNIDAIRMGLWIATATSTGLGVSYLARLLTPYSPSPKEIAALGLLVAMAGFWSFSQNLFVNGFIVLPQFPDLLGGVTATTTLPLIDSSSLTDTMRLPLEDQVNAATTVEASKTSP